MARRTAETFLKYSNRSLQYFNHPNHPEYRGPVLKVKSKEEGVGVGEGEGINHPNHPEYRGPELKVKSKEVGEGGVDKPS